MAQGKVKIILKQVSETIAEFDSYFVPRVGETIQIKRAKGITAWKVDTVRWIVDAGKAEETVRLFASPTWIVNDEN